MLPSFLPTFRFEPTATTKQISSTFLVDRSPSANHSSLVDKSPSTNHISHSEAIYQLKNLQTSILSTKLYPKHALNMTYQLYKIMTTHNLTTKCLKLSSGGQAPLTLTGLVKVWEEDSGIQLADCINKNGLTMLPSCCNAYPTFLDVFMLGTLFYNMEHDVL